MTDTHRRTAPFLYYSLISLVTSVILGGASVALLAIVGQPITRVLGYVVAIVLFEKSMIAGLAASFAHSRGANPELATWFIGWYEARLFGLIVGGIVGARLSPNVGAPAWAGALVGALVLYFVARRLGGGISGAIARRLNTAVGPPVAAPLLAHTRYGIPSLLMRVSSIAIVPAVMVGIGVLLTNEVTAEGGASTYLPIGRIVAVILSALAVATPWAHRDRWRDALQKNANAWRDAPSFVALGLCSAPALYGLVLFLALGASLTELILFAAASSAAAIVWTWKHPVAA